VEVVEVEEEAADAADEGVVALVAVVVDSRRCDDDGGDDDGDTTKKRLALVSKGEKAAEFDASLAIAEVADNLLRLPSIADASVQVDELVDAWPWARSGKGGTVGAVAMLAA